jgi:hypothetical protein
VSSPAGQYKNKGITKKVNRIIYHGYDCKRCNVSGSIYTLLAKLNALYLLQGNQFKHDKLTKFEFDSNLDSDINYEDEIIENKK